jgi:hypothetical protein
MFFEDGTNPTCLRYSMNPCVVEPCEDGVVFWSRLTWPPDESRNEENGGRCFFHELAYTEGALPPLRGGRLHLSARGQRPFIDLPVSPT